MSTRLRGSEQGGQENVNTKFFLSAYMICFRPNHVFEQNGELETNLKTSATAMLHNFEKIIDEIEKKGASDSRVLCEFSTLLFRYFYAFKQWKVTDEQKLVKRIKHVLMALYRAEHQVSPNEPEDSHVRIDFHTQIQRLRSKLLQIGGQEVLDKFDQERTSVTVLMEANSSSLYNTMNIPSRMTNEQLAHELLLDFNFELDDMGSNGYICPLSLSIRDTFHTAFWDSLVDDMKCSPPCYSRVLRVLNEIGGGMIGLSTPNITAMVIDIIDIDHIKAQLQSNVYDWASCTATITGIFRAAKHIQAPRRDVQFNTLQEEVAAKMASATVDLQPTAFCFGLSKCLDIVNIMRVDAANARLRLIAPVIQNHGIDYERSKFNEHIQNGIITKERISEAIKGSVDSLIMNVETRANSRTIIGVCHANLICQLLNGPPIKMENIPETLRFDVQRFVSFQSSMHYMATVLSICNYLKHDSNTSAKFARCIGSVISHIFRETTTFNHFNESDKDSLCACIANAFQLCEPDQCDAVLNNVRFAFNHQNPVSSLM